MEIKEFKVGSRVHMNDEPEENGGTITALGCSRAHVSWDNGNSTNEELGNLTPIIPDTYMPETPDGSDKEPKPALPAPKNDVVLFIVIGAVVLAGIVCAVAFVVIKKKNGATKK